MKKNVFELSYKEGKKVDKELRKTSYYKQYANGYMFSMICLIILSITFAPALYTTEATTMELITPIMIIIGFASLFTLIYWFKRFDLVKQYVEAKAEKENKDDK